MAMLNKLILFFSFFLLFAQISTSQPGKGTIIKEIIFDFKLTIYLPPAYNAAESYKVLYCNDGQTAFGPTGLNFDESANNLIADKLIEPIIIVGIHSDANRNSNYIPYEDESASKDFGAYQPNAAKYSKKIIKQIIPFIEKKYKTKTSRGVAGYSFGGLHATWMTLNYPGEFSFSGSLSPSYWVHDFKIFDEGKKAKNSQTYYFDVGTGEWNYYVPMLLHSNLPILKNIFYYEHFGGYHSINDWKGTRIENILLLFAGTEPLSTYTWELKQEIIKSAYTGKFYFRINPVISYSNGFTCSISYAANFIILNPEDGTVNKDGSFIFIHPKDLKIKVGYRGEEKTIIISYSEVEKIKDGL
jgi:enterochelin esterase-like enzyme